MGSTKKKSLTNEKLPLQLKWKKLYKCERIGNDDKLIQILKDENMRPRGSLYSSYPTEA